MEHFHSQQMHYKSWNLNTLPPQYRKINREKWIALERIVMSWNETMMHVLIHGLPRNSCVVKQMIQYVHRCSESINNALRFAYIKIIGVMKCCLNLFICSFFSQEAIRNQKIDLKELESEHLGTEQELKIPEKKDTKRWWNASNFLWIDKLFSNVIIFLTKMLFKLKKNI